MEPFTHRPVRCWFGATGTANRVYVQRCGRRVAASDVSCIATGARAVYFLRAPLPFSERYLRARNLIPASYRHLRRGRGVRCARLVTRTPKFITWPIWSMTFHLLLFQPGNKLLQ